MSWSERFEDWLERLDRVVEQDRAARENMSRRRVVMRKRRVKMRKQQEEMRKQQEEMRNNRGTGFDLGQITGSLGVILRFIVGIVAMGIVAAFCSPIMMVPYVGWIISATVFIWTLVHIIPWVISGETPD